MEQASSSRNPDPGLPAQDGKPPPTDPLPPNPANDSTAHWPIGATCLVALVWAIGVFALQEYTTSSNYPLPLAKAIGSRVVRMLLDLAACGTTVFLFRGWIRYVAIAASASWALMVVVYYEYYDRSLSLTTIRNHFDEGLAVAAYAADLIHWVSLMSIALTCLIVLVLAKKSHRLAYPFRMRVRWAAIGLAGYVIIACASTMKIDRIAKLRKFGSVDRIAMTNGYLLTWLGEWLYLDAEALLEQANRAAKTINDRLTPIETPIPLGTKVAIVQVESLDDAILAVDVGGEPVTPFLRALSARAMRFRIASIHNSGSCDSDFVMLMNLFPVGNVTPYLVRGFDFRASLAAHVRPHGYRSVFLHGNDGSFFHRGDGVYDMGFDTVLFREELAAQYGLSSSAWGMADENVFAVSSRLMEEDDSPAMHFLITLTTHGPYTFVDPEDRELFASPTNQRERYENSMRYVDTQLRRYFDALPDGSILILYGDHTSHVDYGQPASPPGRELVPFMIAQVGADLSARQQTRNSALATDGELTTLDAAGYIWSLFGERADRPKRR